MSMLNPYRIVDLCGADHLLAGRLFALFGAEVVRVEPEGGADYRHAAELGSELPLSWLAFGGGSRSFEIASDATGAVERLQGLLREADMVIGEETSPLLESLGCAWAQIAGWNPSLVQVVLSDFGTCGHKRDYATTDIVLAAASGLIWQNGSELDEPLRISVPQSRLHCAADAAVAGLIALFARQAGAGGQRVDVSALRSLTTATLGANMAALVGQPDFRLRVAFGAADDRKDPSKPRRLDLSGSGASSGRTRWQALDGIVELHLAMGPATGHFTNALFAYMASQGHNGTGFAWDWTSVHELILDGKVADADMEAARSTVAQFLAQRTLLELAEATIAHRLLIVPCFDIGELSSLDQYAQRGVFGCVVDADGHEWKVPVSFAHIDRQPLSGARTLPPPGDFDGWQPQSIPAVPAKATPVRPFEGLRVIDLSWVVAGPMVGRTLADFGAEVIRVESRKRPDTTRRMAPFFAGVEGQERSALYQTCNLGKLGLDLDLSQEAGRDIVRDLVAKADIVLESFAAGQMARWQLDYDSLKAIKPDLVMLSSALAGQTGPWSRIAGFGNLGSALSGITRLVARKGEEIRGPVVPYTDFLAPRLGLFALLSAVDRQRRTGEGSYIDLSQIESGIMFLAPAYAAYLAEGRIPECLGNADPVMAPHGVYRCADAPIGHSPWVAIAVRHDQDWDRLSSILGCAGDARFVSSTGRREYRDIIDRLVKDWVRKHQARDVEEYLQHAGIPAHVAMSAVDIAGDDHYRAEGIFERTEHPEFGEIVFEASRYRMAGTPARYRGPAPAFGRDTDQVLEKVLGYSQDHIAALRANGVLG